MLCQQHGSWQIETRLDWHWTPLQGWHVVSRFACLFTDLWFSPLHSAFGTHVETCEVAAMLVRWDSCWVAAPMTVLLDFYSKAPLPFLTVNMDCTSYNSEYDLIWKYLVLQPGVVGLKVWALQKWQHSLFAVVVPSKHQLVDIFDQTNHLNWKGANGVITHKPEQNIFCEMQPFPSPTFLLGTNILNPTGLVGNQPRCTSKSGWVTHHADISSARRIQLALATTSGVFISLNKCLMYDLYIVPCLLTAIVTFFGFPQRFTICSRVEPPASEMKFPNYDGLMPGLPLTRVRLWHVQHNESIWTWGPALFGHLEMSLALFGNETRLYLDIKPASIWTWSPPPFGNGARLYLEMEPGSIWKWNPALFGNETRLYLEMEPASIWKWSRALFGHAQSSGLGPHKQPWHSHLGMGSCAWTMGFLLLGAG